MGLRGNPHHGIFSQNPLQQKQVALTRCRNERCNVRQALAAVAPQTPLRAYLPSSRVLWHLTSSAATALHVRDRVEGEPLSSRLSCHGFAKGMPVAPIAPRFSCVAVWCFRRRVPRHYAGHTHCLLRAERFNPQKSFVGGHVDPDGDTAVILPGAS